MLRAEKLSKVYVDKKRGRILAVDNLSFECKPGQIMGLLGLNGAGKTTTLRMLATLLRPTAGTAFVNEVDILKHPDKAKENIGFISGDTGLYRRLTPRETIRYFGDLYGIPRAKSAQRLDEFADRLDMRDYLDTKIDKLSTGQKQKVSIARTMLHDPQVLIMDEPTAGLDIIASANIVELIGRAKSMNRSVIFSTHIMHEAQKICDNIIIIDGGKLIREGSIEKLRAESGIHDLDEIFVNSVRSVQ
ncbi:MAG: ATP-binding cassette domain-containing protein [candidate division Zixibacteria bacterium]|nr:ATP-binding cassette domain-containing protein [candidate division Zixibacteria bacterium]